MMTKAGIKMTETNSAKVTQDDAVIVKHDLVNNAGRVVGTEEVQYVPSNPGHSGRSFNTIAVPVLYVDSSVAEEEKATEDAKKIAGKSDADLSGL